MPDFAVCGLDHFVLTVADAAATQRFYAKALGMEPITFGAGRLALRFGSQKINLHEVGHLYAPYAARPTPGSADLCFRTQVPVAEFAAHLKRLGIAIEEGPVRRTGARGPLLSVYIRDPDGNLVEVSNEIAG